MKVPKCDNHLCEKEAVVVDEFDNFYCEECMIEEMNNEDLCMDDFETLN